MDASHKLARVAGMRAAALAVAGLSAILIAPKCGTEIVVPAEDRTPPSVRLTVVRADNKSEVVPAEGLRVAIAPGEQLVIFAEGTDPSGLARVAITSSSDMICAGGTMTEERREDVTHTEKNDVKPGEVGNTELFTSLALDSRFSCATGLSPRSRRLTIFATAENYHGGISTTPTLVVEVDTSLPPIAPPR